jgi:hypothetical protein
MDFTIPASPTASHNTQPQYPENIFGKIIIFMANLIYS